MDNESVISLKCEQMDDRSESDEENIYHVADEFEVRATIMLNQ